ncbi:MAG: ribonuclease P protein component [Lentisphaeria bacterium]|nr:ribonuclease P protein component [Lentisphaeria bacterium]
MKSLCKSDKLRCKTEFDQVRRDGTKYVGRGMLVVVAPAPDDLRRCGVICGKKYSLLAVDRNRARRLLWESFRLLKPEIATCRLVLIPRRTMMKWKRAQVTRDLAAMLLQAGLIPQEVADSPPEC